MPTWFIITTPLPALCASPTCTATPTNRPAANSTAPRIRPPCCFRKPHIVQHLTLPRRSDSLAALTAENFALRASYSAAAGRLLRETLQFRRDDRGTPVASGSAGRHSR